MSARQLKPRLEMDNKGRVLIPKIIREELKLTKGALMEAEIYGNDKILLTILAKPNKLIEKKRLKANV